VRIPKLGIHLAELNSAVVFTSTAVQLSALQVRSGSGQLTGSGTIGLVRGADAKVDLTLHAERFQVVHTDQYQAALSGRLLASGSLQQPVINGALTVEETTLRPTVEFLQSKPPPPDPTITVVRSSQDPRLVSATPTQASGVLPPGAEPESASSGADAPPLFERITLDITVKIPRDTWVNVEDGAVEFYGDVRIRKAAGESVAIVGTLESVRGWYSYRGRKFRVERGT
jgi:translocation and assembly module TamB